MTEQQSGPARPPYPREPNVHSGGKQEPGSDRDLPPYDDRQTTGKSQEELEQERVGAGHSAPPRQVSDAEREGMTDTDMAPAGPEGVGISTSTRGEDLSSGMSEAGQKKDRLDSGLSDVGNKRDPDSPVTSSGDQGG